MIRRIITINEAACNGCGLCAEACHEGAIGIVDGKAKLLREDYCDGLGDCLPACPMNAISFEEREAPAYNEAAVQKALDAGFRTGDMMAEGCQLVSCSEMGDAILSFLSKIFFITRIKVPGVSDLQSLRGLFCCFSFYNSLLSSIKDRLL